MRFLTESLIQETGFGQVSSAVEAGRSPVVVSGLDGIHRAHAAAFVRSSTKRPAVVICANEMEMKRTAADLKALTGEEVTTITGREFTFYNAEGVSRQLEQLRLRALHRLLSGDAEILVTTADGLMQRTMPPDVMRASAVTLKMGGQYELAAVTAALVRCGYSRSQQVEGPGQFALRGGILDFFSPSGDEPFRVEFFGDEVDSVSTFDVSTQRRIQTCDIALILPAAETLASMYRGNEGNGEEGLIKHLETILQGLEKRRTGVAELKKHITSDIERLENRRSFPAADKYMELIYPMSTALDYVDDTAVIFINEPSKAAERAKNYMWQLEEDSRTLLEAGILDSSLVRFSVSWDELCEKAEDFPVVMTDSFTASKYPLNREKSSVFRQNSCRHTAAVWRRRLAISPIISVQGIRPSSYARMNAGLGYCRSI